MPPNRWLLLACLLHFPPAAADGSPPQQCPPWNLPGTDASSSSSSAITNYLVAQLDELRRAPHMQAGGQADLIAVDAVVRDLFFWLGSPSYCCF